MTAPHLRPAEDRLIHAPDPLVRKSESSGDWSADTGNGYHGGLQFDPTTWEAFGGQGSPSSATREQQIDVAKKIQAEQGWRAWPSCSKKLGLG